MRVVRSKIIGEAREVLIASGNPKEWDEIKDVILHSFGDKRDITSHIQSLFYVKQGKISLTEYFQKVKAIDTAIKSSAAQMEDYRGSMDAVNKLISLMSLTRYVDGLNGDQLSMYVRSYRPTSLEEAHDITMQHSNASFRQKLENKQMPSTFRTPEQKPHTFAPAPRNNNNIRNGQAIKQGSDRFKFKNQAAHGIIHSAADDDVSMRTYQSKMQVHNHEAGEVEPDTPLPVDDSILESDDDDFFVGGELNFQMDGKERQKT